MKISIKDYFKRNKRFFIVSLILFIFVLVLGIIFGYMLVNGQNSMIHQSLNSSNSTPLSDLKISPLLLFSRNVSVDLLTIVSGLLFSILSVVIVAYNGFLIGIMFGADWLLGVLGIVPHGIFEYTASIFSLVAAFIITKIEINIIKAIFSKEKTVKGVLIESKVDYIDILISVVFVIVLLVIAALIEAYVTPFIVTSYFGF